MIKITRQQLNKLRRTVLSAQGLNQVQPFGRGLDGVAEAIRHLGYVQLDSISVVERAHHHVLFNRVPGYQPDMLNELMLNGAVFEYWAHAAAVLPMGDFRYSLPYKNAIKSGQIHWYKNPDKKLMHELLARIRHDGPLRSRDLESRAKKTTGWWDWKPAKKAIEQLYMQGDLMVSNREGFQKTYDLTERVLPSTVNTRIPSAEEFAAHLLQQQLRNYGVVSLKGLTYLRRNKDLKQAMKTLVEECVVQGDLVQVQLLDQTGYLVKADSLNHVTPQVKNQLRIMSPFDNCVIQRDRLKALFGFDYQLECYVPAAKRRFGYFSLPLLYRDQFVGRMDCKAHRKESRLEIKSLHIETDEVAQDRFIDAFVQAIMNFCDFQQCENVILSHPQPDQIGQLVKKSLKQLS